MEEQSRYEHFEEDQKFDFYDNIPTPLKSTLGADIVDIFNSRWTFYTPLQKWTVTAKMYIEDEQQIEIV
tara:strand:+ start:206 stop:412 length:207 start_codon:yes stop_codon:yes gene_type:complete